MCNVCPVLTLHYHSYMFNLDGQILTNTQNAKALLYQNTPYFCQQLLFVINRSMQRKLHLLLPLEFPLLIRSNDRIAMIYWLSTNHKPESHKFRRSNTTVIAKLICFCITSFLFDKYNTPVSYHSCPNQKKVPISGGTNREYRILLTNQRAFQVLCKFMQSTLNAF